MDSRLRIVVEGDILKAVLPEYTDRDAAMGWLRTIVEKAIENNLNKVLADVRQMGKIPPVLDLYEIADQAGKMASAKGVRFGFWATSETSDPERIFVTMSSNRGLNVFTSLDYDEVLAWLNR